MFKILTIVSLLLTGSANAASTSTVKADSIEGSSAYQNIVKNSQCEPGTGKSYFSTSGSGTLSTTTTAANVGRGSQSCTWDSGTASETLTGTLVTIPAGLRGRSAEFSGLFQCSSGTCTHELHTWDGTTDVTLGTIVSGTTFVRSTYNFIMPSSGSISARIKAVASNEPQLNYDDLRVGEATNVGTVNQAQMVGFVTFPGTASCNWSSTSNATFGNFSADADCTLPTGTNVSGLVEAPGTKIPAIVLKNVTPGRTYRMTATAGFYSTTSACSWRFSDGTVSSSPQAANNASTTWGIIQGDLVFTTGGDKTVNIQGTGTFGNTQCNIEAGSSVENLYISAVSFPSTSEQVYRPDTLPLSWSGYTNSISGGCSSTSATYADPSSCTSIALTELTNRNFGTVTTAGSSLPGITFTPVRSGRYYVCSIVNVQTSANTGLNARLVDGSGTVIDQGHASYIGSNYLAQMTLCGIYNVSTIASTTIKVQIATNGGNTIKVGTQGFTVATGTSDIQWSIFAIDQAFPAPVLVGSVTSQSTGAERIERVKVTATCSASPCTVADKSGTWVTDITRSSAGAYSVNYPSSTWSSAPTCLANGAPSSNLASCNVYSTSTTAALVQCSNQSNTATDLAPFYIICMGPR